MRASDYSQQYHESPSESRHQFLRRFEATATLSRARMYARPEPPTWNPHIDPYDYRHTTIDIKREPLVEMTIPQHRFEELVSMEQALVELQNTERRHREILRGLREDEAIRNSNPAVAKAYRNYITLLELARN